jgi:hypothetical protein
MRLCLLNARSANTYIYVYVYVYVYAFMFTERIHYLTKGLSSVLPHNTPQFRVTERARHS